MSDIVPAATTRLFLLLGDPVAHSLSPTFQNAAMRARGIDALYAAIRCDRASVAPLIRALCHADGGGNVTVPHKAAAAECIERPSEAVRRTGVCNTFWGERGVIHGDNTDVEGFRAATLELLPSLEGISVLVIGAGGAALAAVTALIDGGAGRVLVLNRSPERAETLARRVAAGSTVVTPAAARTDAEDGAFDLVVNATPLGLGADESLPLDLARCRRVGAVLDTVYSEDRQTPFVAHARALGIPAADGTAMLVAQGAAAFTRWFGGPPPNDVMRAALRRLSAPAS